MKRTLSGSHAQKAVDTPRVSYHEMNVSPSELEAPQIPPEVRKHIECLSRYPPSQICQWIDIWQRSKDKENNGIVLRSCFNEKCSDLPGDDSDIWVFEDIEFPVKSEQQRISSPIASRSESARSQLEVAKCPHLSPQRHVASAPIVHQSLRKQTLATYACSFCDKMFSRKGDWKRHEESLHEPQRQWCCLESGCNRKFTAGNKFRQHHQTDHGCQNCNHNKDAAIISMIQTTSVWGCGFCIAFLTTWDERANHIGRHFDTGSKRSDWDVSKVIQSLLRQPTMFDTWQSLLRSIHGPSEINWPRFEWPVKYSQELLKSLQCVNSEQSAANIAQSAYNLLVHSNSRAELDTLTPYESLESFLAPVTSQEFLVDSFEPDNSLPTLSNTLIEGNEAFQTGQTLGNLVSVASDHAGAYDIFTDCHVADGYFQDLKDYTTPCAENFEPTAWTLWPYADTTID